MSISNEEYKFQGTRIAFSHLNLVFISFFFFFCVECELAQAQSRTSFLDSVFQAQLNNRIKLSGKNPVYNYQFYFNYNNQYIFNGAAGISQKKHTDLPLHYKFKSASVAKPMVAAIVLQLYEEGKIHLDSSCTRYLDKDVVKAVFGNSTVYKNKKVNVRQLLNHTAGLPDYIFDDKRFLWSTHFFPGRKHRPKDHVNRYKKHKLYKGATLPGEKYRYCDTHYLLLALLIEHVTGNSLQLELNERIVSPLGLKNTYIDHWDSVYTKTMHQYVKRRDITKKLHPSFEYGGGGFITTTQDLAIFIQALVKGELFQSKETLNQMLWYDQNKYGLGISIIEIPENWIVQEGKDTLVAYGHDGFFGVEMYYIPEKNITIVVSRGQAHTKDNMFSLWLMALRKCHKMFD